MLTLQIINWLFIYPSTFPGDWSEFRVYHFGCEAVIAYSRHTYIVLQLSTFNFIWYFLFQPLNLLVHLVFPVSHNRHSIFFFWIQLSDFWLIFAQAKKKMLFFSAISAFSQVHDNRWCTQATHSKQSVFYLLKVLIHYIVIFTFFLMKCLIFIYTHFFEVQYKLCHLWFIWEFPTVMKCFFFFP